MPTFYTEAQINVDLDEFLEQCTEKELKELYEALQKDYDMEEETDDQVRSESQRVFNRNIRTLKENWPSITKEDAQIIEVLGKKYGAV